MRIAHISPSFYPAVGYGGPIESSYRLCCSLARTGAKVRVLTTDANGLRSRLKERSGRGLRLDEGFEVRYCRRIARHSVAPDLLRRLPSYVRWADVVHLTAVYSFPTIPTLAACRLFGKPLVWSPRGGFQRWDGSRRVWAKALWGVVCRTSAPQNVVLHFTSEEEARESEQQFEGARACVVPNGVTVLERTVHVTSSGKLRLLFFGRLDPIKGLENLFEASAIALKEHAVRLHLAVVGHGETQYVNALRQRIAGLGITDVVSMHEWAETDEKIKVFEQTDVLVVPSYKESFAMVVAEALSHGIPVIAGTGTPWARVEEVGCGLWVANEPKSLAWAIARASRMPLQEMGDRGRDWMRREFSWPRIATRMLELYREVVRRDET